MRSCLIMGSGRSGTSMLAGVLSRAGYYMGGNLWPAGEANPKGFFEDVDINWINEQLLSAVTRPRPPHLPKPLYRSRPVLWQRWLADVPAGTEIPVTASLAGRIAAEVATAPFCFKDPRFCYTLPVWRPHLGDAAFLCIFRHPADTVHSILRECRQAPYLRDFRITAAGALRVWTSMYRHVLEGHSATGDWLFLHYDQVLDGSAAGRLQELVGVAGDWAFPESRLRTSTSTSSVGGEAEHVYEELCRRAGAHGARPAKRPNRSTRFQETPLQLSTRDIFDLGVADLDGEGRFGVFTTNHNSRQTLLANHGGGVFVDVVDQLGLNHDPDIAGWDDDVTLPTRRRSGIYLYRQGITVMAEHIGDAGVDPVNLELGFASQLEVGEPERAAVEVRPDGRGAVVSCRLQAGARVSLTPQLVGVPMTVRIDQQWPLEQFHVGSSEVHPSAHSFTLRLRDRHGMAWTRSATQGLGAIVVRGGLKGRLSEFPGLVADEVFVGQQGRLADICVRSGFEKGGCRSRQVTWVNLVGDDRPALFVSCARGSPRLYRQSGDLSFTDVTNAMGLHRIGGTTFGWADLDGDGHAALLAVDGEELAVFQGDGNGPFVKRQTVRLRNRGGMVGRLAIADWRSRGRPDIFVPSPPGNTLVLNDGGRLRAVHPRSVGLPAKDGITAQWVDYDNDGLMDLHVLPGDLYRQHRAGTFQPTGLLDGLLPSPIVDVRACWFDSQNSGRRDVLVAVATEPKVRHGRFEWKTAFLRNTGPSGHWLQLDLSGPRTNSQAIGASVTVRAGQRSVTQWVGDSEGSHYSAGHYRLYFGLGDHPLADSVEVRWPDGTTDQLGRRGDELIRIAQ